MMNADKPMRWKSDIAASVDQFNAWFMKSAPVAFRNARVSTTDRVAEALRVTKDLSDISSSTLTAHPEALPTLRMSTAPPLAVDRLMGLARVNKNLVKRMEQGSIPPKMESTTLKDNLDSMSRVLLEMLDYDIFPWLPLQRSATDIERERAATIVADRLCNAVANPIIRNAQETRQLAEIGAFLDRLGYTNQSHHRDAPLEDMQAGTYALRMNVSVGTTHSVKLPIDVVIQPKKRSKNGIPIFIEAKSAGDFTNTNKRRKEEATKMRQLSEAFGPDVRFILFLCGYFESGYLGYEAAEGIDWVWEHRIEDLLELGLAKT